MDDLPTTYYFGRIHLNRSVGDDFSKDHKKWCLEQIKSLLYKPHDITPLRPNTDFNWYFGGIHEADDLIIGKLGRVRKRKTKTYYDKEKRDFKDEEVEDEDGSYSNFFIDCSKMLIIFERRKIVGQMQFRDVFSNDYNTFFKQEEGMSIEFLKDETKIEEIIKDATIHYMNFTVVPTNPDAFLETRIIDEELKRMQAKKAKLRFENKEGGMKIEEDSIASSAIALCNRGYGDYTIDYEKEGKTGRISSKRKAIAHEEKRPKTAEEAIKIAKKLLEYANKLLKLKDAK